MKEGERRHFSEYYDQLQMDILWAIVDLKRNGVHFSPEQLDYLLEVKSGHALRDAIKTIYAGPSKA